MNPRAKSPTQAPDDRSEDPPRERAVDVIVLGGGPAGTAAAIALAGFGWSVTILEQSHYESTRIGETLPPEVKRPLTALGLWERFLADGPVESPGIASAWGQAELYDNDFIVNPLGPGWHVDRLRFDAMLACAAEARGVEVLRGARGLSLSHVAQFRGSEGEVPSELDWKAAPALGAGLMPPPSTPALGAGLMPPPSTRPQASLARTEPESVVGGLPATWCVGFVGPAQRLVRRSALLVDATGRGSTGSSSGRPPHRV
jgi:FAD binding domain